MQKKFKEAFDITAMRTGATSADEARVMSRLYPMENMKPLSTIHTLWERVQFLLQKKSFTPSRFFDGEFLLSGLIRCPKCVAAMVACRTRSKGLTTASYEQRKTLLHMYIKRITMNTSKTS
ncbi:hypothetical protein AB4114_20235 [Paenibacillus sp. 2RAB27]|uniref:hypothetical protein n=1 Tax=Paenibacillus sp. 2RAB27 TaxID=3232991 RepID=UPI003F98BF5B